MRAAMQEALDSTALKLASANASSAADAPQIFNAIFTKSGVQDLSVSGEVDESSNKVSVTASGSIKTAFMSIMGVDNLALKVQASASRKQDDSGCVLALDPTASGAVSDGGSNSTELKNCSAFSNSNSDSAFYVGGSATLDAYSIGTVGNTSISPGNVTTTEGIRTHVHAISDPFYKRNFPSFGDCTQTNLRVNKSTTINAGVYCNGIAVNAGATLTMNPGIYYIDRGSFTVNGGATVIGTGVTLVFTSSTGSNWATASINGGATVNLTAPTGGPTGGMVVFADRQTPTGTTFKFNGGSTQYLGGAIYVPTGAVNFAGGVATSTSCTKIVGDTVTFTGSSNVAINCSSYPIESFGLTAVRLDS